MYIKLKKSFYTIKNKSYIGIRVTHFLSGWKSDFEDRDENIRALIYFLDHANRGKLLYHEPQHPRRRFLDVPMESYGQVLPLRVAIQNGAPDILLIMLRYGAIAVADKSSPTPIENLLTRLNESEPEDPALPCNYPQDLLTCLRFLLRAIPTVTVKTPEHIANQSGVLQLPLHEQYPNLVERSIVPPERSGVNPPELQHLCRCRIRELLFENWALPGGIQTLDVPPVLRNYLDLLYD